MTKTGTTITLPDLAPDTIRGLKQVASQRGMTVPELLADVITNIVRGYLGDLERKPQRPKGEKLRLH